MRTITLELPYPPSVNSCWRCTLMNGRPRLLLSRAGRNYREKVIDALRASGGLSGPLAGKLHVFIHLFPPDKRKRDIDNPIKPLLDALQHAGVYEDDAQICSMTVNRADPDPDRKGVTVSLTAETRP